MNKPENLKNIAKKLLDDYGVIECRKLIKEIQKLLDLCVVKIYYSGDLDDSKKQIIAKWLNEKVKGHYETEYIEDSSLISGLKIVYRDFNYEDSLESDLKKLLWKM